MGDHPVLAVVGTADHVIPPAQQLFMATHARPHHQDLSMLSNPGTVTRVIEQAARATR